MQLNKDMKDWNYFESLLTQNIPFSFSKFNDGEIACILDSTPNCVVSRGFQKSSPELSKKLGYALFHQQKNYYIGLPCFSCYSHLRTFCDSKVNHSNCTLSNVFINSNLNKSVNLFRDILPQRRVVFICSEKAKTDSLPFQPYLVFRTPNNDAWSYFDKVKNLYTIFSPGDVVILACGPLGRVLAYEWFLKRGDITCLELGSFYDPLTTKKSYLYHEGVLPYCQECNPHMLDILPLEIENCTNREFIYYTDMSTYLHAYNGHSPSIYRAFKRALGVQPNQDYFCHCQIVKHAPNEEAFNLAIEISKKYPDRAEHVMEAINKTEDKNKQNTLYKMILELPLPIGEYVNENLYNWQILDQYVIFAYYRDDHEESYMYWQKLMNMNKFPEHHRERITDNGRYSKIKLDDKLDYNITSYNNFLMDLQNHPAYNETHDKIPKYFHFIYISGGVDFCMMHYVAIRSCFNVHKPKQIFIYTNIEPKDNHWWELAKNCATIIKVTIPCFVNNQKITFKQHQADLMRIHILHKIGGVYMDIDVLSLQPLDGSMIKPICEQYSNTADNLYENCTVMSKESPNKLANCVIMSRKNNPFIEEWIVQYETNYGNHQDWWVGLSVITPYYLALKMPDKISILTQKMFIPFLYDNMDFFYKDISNTLTESFTVHLWETETRKTNLIPRNKQYFSNNNNTFTKLYKNLVE
jgi:mannosyltransferase OCH1-like enzyme